MPKPVVHGSKRSPMLYIGVDPGLSGAIAGIIETSRFCIPLAKLTEHDIFDTLHEMIKDVTPLAMLEQVHAMPKQGVSSTFKFGRCYGHLEMALVGNNIPYTLITPQKWQKAMSCLSRGDKNVTKRRAQQLFPKIKITHATADALLLAEYCRISHAKDFV